MIFPLDRIRVGLAKAVLGERFLVVRRDGLGAATGHVRELRHFVVISGSLNGNHQILARRSRRRLLRGLNEAQDMLDQAKMVGRT